MLRILGMSWRGSPTLPSSLQDLGENSIQLWTQISARSLRQFIETMSRQMHTLIKVEGNPTK